MNYTGMAAQLELPHMNDCPRCDGRYKKCSLCFGTGKIPEQMLLLCRLIVANKTSEREELISSHDVIFAH